MAIKLPDPGNGIPEQKTGNDEWTNMKIVRDNFADSSNAASRLVGTSNGNLVAYEDIPSASLRRPLTAKDRINEGDFNDLTDEGIYYSVNGLQNSPDVLLGVVGSHWYIDVYNLLNLTYQRATGHSSGDIYIRSYTSSGGWTSWRSVAEVSKTYKITTGTAPNVVVGADGSLKRSSSSAKYKEVIKKLELDSDLYDKAMQVKPIIYRSKSEGDPKNWHYMSFLAEEIGELDPSLTQWSTYGTNPETGERIELEKKEAEGINLNAICAVLHATNIYQDKKLKELEKRLSALEG